MIVLRWGCLLTLLILGIVQQAHSECIHHWEFDEMAGEVAVNTVKPNAPGLYRHSPKLGQASLYPKLGKAVSFAGGETAQDVELPHDTVGLGSLTENFTVLAWVNFQHLGGANTIISGRNGIHNWSLVVLRNGILRVQTFDAKQKLVGQVFNRTPLAVNMWYLIGVSVASDKTIRFYIDGDLDRKKEIADLGAPTQQSFFVAGRGQGFNGASINGLIADVQIYNSVLEDKQVQTLFDSVIPE